MIDHLIQNETTAEILVVDDFPENLKLLTSILTDWGYRVRPASSGRLALKSVAARMPDLILLDVRMPEMDGYEVCLHLKADEKSRDIPVIFISALNEARDKVKGFDAGGVDFITKPFQSEEVKARVQTHLALRSLQKRLESQNAQLQQEIIERVRAEEELRKSKDELQSLSFRLLGIQEEERKRIAGELHDSIGQTLAALKYGIEGALAAGNRGDIEETIKYLDRLVPFLQHSIEETRSIYMGLRPTMLDNMGISATLRWFCRTILSLNPKYHIELDIRAREDEIAEPQKIVIFRIIQEALNNVAKHSKAEWVDLSLVEKGDTIELTIADDGVGFDSCPVLFTPNTARGFGLIGMRERAELSGGTLSIESTPGKGTVVRATWLKNTG